MYKFCTMTDERDSSGNLLLNEQRLPKFCKWLRSTSLDELSEAFNIFKGDMSIIGTRPQLVRNMEFMDEKFGQDLRYIEKDFVLRVICRYYGRRL